MVLAEKKTNCWGETEICGRTDQTREWIKSILYISTRRRFYKAKGHIDRNSFIWEQIDWHPIRNEL